MERGKLKRIIMVTVNSPSEMIEIAPSFDKILSLFPCHWHPESGSDRRVLKSISKWIIHRLNLSTVWQVCCIKKNFYGVGKTLIPNISEWPDQTRGLKQKLLPMTWIITLDTVLHGFLLHSSRTLWFPVTRFNSNVGNPA